jgi:hypothetical protein
VTAGLEVCVVVLRVILQVGDVLAFSAHVLSHIAEQDIDVAQYAVAHRTIERIATGI